jgi:hypothetical protein
MLYYPLFLESALWIKYKELVKLLPGVKTLPENLIEVLDNQKVYSTLYAIFYLKKKYSGTMMNGSLLKKSNQVGKVKKRKSY